MSLKHAMLRAAKASEIPEGSSGPWTITRLKIAKPILVPRNGKIAALVPDTYTQLWCRQANPESFSENAPYGECVMEDTIYELRTHLDFMLRAKGRVLVTGLGLGCVVRGLLANPAVTFVLVIEKSSDVLKLVGPHMPEIGKRLDIVLADALEWVAQNKGHFDCAWHDLWTDTTAGEPHLAVWHQQLFYGCLDKVGFQGAWAYPRYLRRQARQIDQLAIL